MMQRDTRTRIQEGTQAMDQHTIFGPVLGTMLLTFVVWVCMYARRIPFIRGLELTPEQLTAVEFARIQPPAVINPSDNLKNLFELPTVFYGVVAYLYVTGQVDSVYLGAAWVFFVFRVLHSAVHCTVNVIIVRFWLYCVSALALWFMLLRAAVAYIV
jgi:hypothetical protein